MTEIFKQWDGLIATLDDLVVRLDAPPQNLAARLHRQRPVQFGGQGDSPIFTHEPIPHEVSTGPDITESPHDRISITKCWRQLDRLSGKLLSEVQCSVVREAFVGWQSCWKDARHDVERSIQAHEMSTQQATIAQLRAANKARSEVRLALCCRAAAQASIEACFAVWRDELISRVRAQARIGKGQADDQASQLSDALKLLEQRDHQLKCLHEALDAAEVSSNHYATELGTAQATVEETKQQLLRVSAEAEASISIVATLRAELVDVNSLLAGSKRELDRMQEQLNLVCVERDEARLEATKAKKEVKDFHELRGVAAAIKEAATAAWEEATQAAAAKLETEQAKAEIANSAVQRLEKEKERLHDEMVLLRSKLSATAAAKTDAEQRIEVSKSQHKNELVTMQGTIREHECAIAHLRSTLAQHNEPGIPTEGRAGSVLPHKETFGPHSPSRRHVAAAPAPQVKHRHRQPSPEPSLGAFSFEDARHLSNSLSLPVLATSSAEKAPVQLGTNRRATAALRQLQGSQWR